MSIAFFWESAQKEGPMIPSALEHVLSFVLEFGTRSNTPGGASETQFRRKFFAKLSYKKAGFRLRAGFFSRREKRNQKTARGPRGAEVMASHDLSPLSPRSPMGS